MKKLRLPKKVPRTRVALDKLAQENRRELIALGQGARKRGVDTIGLPFYKTGEADDIVWENFNVSKATKTAFDFLCRNRGDRKSQVLRRLVRLYLEVGGDLQRVSVKDTTVDKLPDALEATVREIKVYDSLRLPKVDAPSIVPVED